MARSSSRARPARKSQVPKQRGAKKNGLPDGAERVVVSEREFARFAQAMEQQSAATQRLNELADVMCAARDISNAQVLGIDPDTRALIIRRTAAPEPAEAPE